MSSEPPVMLPEVDSIYRHYKGGEYRVICFAEHSESGDDLVVYRSLTTGDTYVRPLFSSFNHTTQSMSCDGWCSPTRDGQARFTFLRKASE